MKIAIIGGKLQGTEVAFLAQKAGIYTVLIDKTAGTPASGICDEEVILDVTSKSPQVIQILKNADIVVPAMENLEALNALEELNKQEDLQIAVDFNSYKITSSKLKTDEIIHNGNYPHPIYYPDAKPPYILKPSEGSGSSSVELLKSEDDLLNSLKKKQNADEWVVQEYIKGKSYSIEVVGCPGNYKVYSMTEIHLDDSYDCNLVTCPVNLPEAQIEKFQKDSISLAEDIGLVGLMDVEAIGHNGELKIIEIDARFPSQTPIAVYYSSGVNLLVELIKTLDNNSKDYSVSNNTYEFNQYNKGYFSSYQHYQFEKGKLFSLGEHCFGKTKPLSVKEAFFGADIGITDYQSGSDLWQTVLIHYGNNEDVLRKKRIDSHMKLLDFVSMYSEKEI